MRTPVVAQSKGKRTRGFIDEPPLVTGDGKTLRGADHCFFGHPFTMVIDRRVSGFERQTSCYPKGGWKLYNEKAQVAQTSSVVPKWVKSGKRPHLENLA